MVTGRLAVVNGQIVDFSTQPRSRQELGGMRVDGYARAPQIFRERRGRLIQAMRRN